MKEKIRANLNIVLALSIVCALMFLIPIGLITFYNPITALFALLNSEYKTEILLPENLIYDFSEVDFENYVLSDTIEVVSSDENNKNYISVRDYYDNKYTDEKIIKVTRKDNGKFIKGYYLSQNCRCAFFNDKTMRLTGKKNGKVYSFKNKELQYVSEYKTYDSMFGSVYVTTFFGPDSKRIAIKTEPSSMSGNTKAKKTFYKKYYNSFFVTISERGFLKRIGSI